MFPLSSNALRLRGTLVSQQKNDKYYFQWWPTYLSDHKLPWAPWPRPHQVAPPCRCQHCCHCCPYKAIIVNDNHQARSDWPQRKDWVGHSPTSELTVHIALDLCFETCIWSHSDQSPFPQVFSRGKPKGGNLLIFWSLNIIELGSDLWVLVSLTYSLS